MEFDPFSKPSRWRVRGTTGFNAGLALGVGHETLTIERPGEVGYLTYDSMTGGFSIANESIGFSNEGMPSAENYGIIYLNPNPSGFWNHEGELALSDFNGLARSVNVGITVGETMSVGMYVFGTLSTVSSACAGVPHASLAAMFATAKAWTVVDAGGMGSVDVGVTFGIGAVTTRFTG